MKRHLKIWLAAALGFALSIGLAGAASQPPDVGGNLPEITLDAPQDAELQLYLGLSRKQTFTIPEIQAEVVLIEIFSMY